MSSLFASVLVRFVDDCVIVVLVKRESNEKVIRIIAVKCLCLSEKSDVIENRFDVFVVVKITVLFD